jgi:trk system potassium uptake protein TrkH
VFTGLDNLPVGINLWRGLLQWFGGIGIIVVAMVFLPELRVGGMQIFRSEAFDTMGKILPRATEIAARISVIYLALTVVCALTYGALGMPAFDALMHALTTISTGGFSSRDASFGTYQGPLEYVAAVFMILASLPFVRYIQLVAGTARPILRDSQVRAYPHHPRADRDPHALPGDLQRRPLGTRVARGDLQRDLDHLGDRIRLTDYQLWGGVPVVLFFFIGLIGGCAGSTSCSIKVFRYQLLFASISTQVRRLYAPHGVFEPRYDGRPIAEEVLSSVMAFFVLFFVSLGIVVGAAGPDRARLRHLGLGRGDGDGQYRPGPRETRSGPRAISRPSTTPPSGSCRRAMLVWGGLN